MPILSKNFFEFFGLEPKLRLDLESLQKRFYELSRNWHPDRFARGGAEEQSRALEATAILNDGYRTLRDPVKRAEYLLTEEGFPIGEQRSKDVPPELLEEVFDLNMMLEEVKNGRAQRNATAALKNSKDGASSSALESGDEAARPQLELAKQHFLELKQGVDGELENLFSKYDVAESQSETAKQALHEIRGALNRRRYIENLIRDVEAALGSAHT